MTEFQNAGSIAAGSMPPFRWKIILITSVRRYGMFLLPADMLSVKASSEEITNLLRVWNGGDEAALGRLAEHVYPDSVAIACHIPPWLA